MVLGKPKLSWCDIGFAQIQVWSHIHFLGSLVFHTFIGASFTGRGHFRACSLPKTACWWAANVHQRPSALSSSKTGWPSGAWDRELGSLEGCTGSNCLGAKHATGRSPILLLPARHAACGGRRNRIRGDTSCNKENCTHDERGGGSRDLLRHHWDGLSQLAVAHRTAHRAQTALLLVRPNNRSPSLLTRRAGHRPPGSRTS